MSLNLRLAIIPPGPWAIGVSGGADSVALLALLRTRADLSLHVVHLDHQTRGDQSTGDADFVAQLAGRWHLPVTVARRDQLEPDVPHPPKNPSAHYRELRLALFRQVVTRHHLQGVILAHHRDDQVETILHRLIRAGAAASLAGMAPRTTIERLAILRPLLDLPRSTLRDYLLREQIPWREDASNLSDAYLRNRLRKLLAAHRQLGDPLLEMAQAARRLRDWTQANAPYLPEKFQARALAHWPRMLSRQATRTWLRKHGCPPQELSHEVLDRLIDMADDAASPSRQYFPGRVLVARRRGSIEVLH
jgi:tRNA(Ile)-lysidine synthase